jgi:hypothetical protein
MVSLQLPDIIAFPSRFVRAQRILRCILRLALTGIASLIASITRACFAIGQSPSSERKRLNIGRATAVTRPIMSHASSSQSPATTPRDSRSKKKNDDSDANIRNFAPVARIMKTALPENAKIAKEAKECMQECVSEFISFITSEGMFGLEV